MKRLLFIIIFQLIFTNLFSQVFLNSKEILEKHCINSILLTNTKDSSTLYYEFDRFGNEIYYREFFYQEVTRITQYDYTGKAKIIIINFWNNNFQINLYHYNKKNLFKYRTVIRGGEADFSIDTLYTTQIVNKTWAKESKKNKKEQIVEQKGNDLLFYTWENTVGAEYLFRYYYNKVGLINRAELYNNLSGKIVLNLEYHYEFYMRSE